MSVVRKTVTFTEKQDLWIKVQIQSGEFTNDSEYLRSLVRQDQAQNDEFRALKTAIIEGVNSGVSNKSIPEIMKDVEKRMKLDGQL